MILYSRHDCPLCEEVEDMLIRANISYDFINIDDDEALRKAYHVRVPVLVNAHQKELTWPFDEQQLQAFAMS